MTPDRSYIKGNDAERARLKALLATCTEADLARPMPEGWTVASVLLHMAFWDQRIVVLLDAWQKHGVIPRLEDSADVDWTNDSVKPMLLAVAPRAAADLALRIAETTDAMVAALPWLGETFIMARPIVSDSRWRTARRCASIASPGNSRFSCALRTARSRCTTIS